MPKLHPISRRALILKLRALGFHGPYSGTRHQYMEKGSHHIFIPNPHGGDIGTPLLKQMIRQLHIERDRFIEL